MGVEKTTFRCSAQELLIKVSGYATVVVIAAMPKDDPQALRGRVITDRLNSLRAYALHLHHQSFYSETVSTAKLIIGNTTPVPAMPSRIARRPPQAGQAHLSAVPVGGDRFVAQGLDDEVGHHAPTPIELTFPQ